MPPLKISTAIDIAASPETVWQTLTDWPRYPQWNPFIVGLHGRHQIGARLLATLLAPGGKRVTFRPTLLRLDKDRALVWQGRLLHPRLLAGRHHFELEPLPDGGTRFHHYETFHGLLLPLLRAALLKSAGKGFEQMNRALKQRCETLASAARA